MQWVFREPELLEGEENKRDQGQNLLQFNENSEGGFQITTQKGVSKYAGVSLYKS